MSLKRRPIKVGSAKSNGKLKLTDVEGHMVLRQIVSHRSNAQIVKWAKEYLGKSISGGVVNRYREDPRYTSDMERFRREFEDAVGAEEFASKRRRIQELSKIYQEIEERRDLMPRKERMALMDAVGVMDKIDGIVTGRKKGGDTTVQIQYNKFEHMQTQELLNQAGKLVHRIAETKDVKEVDAE